MHSGRQLRCVFGPRHGLGFTAGLLTQSFEPHRELDLQSNTQRTCEEWATCTDVSWGRDSNGCLERVGANNTVVRGQNGSTFRLISWRINNRGGVLYTPKGGSGIVQRICDGQKCIGKLNLAGVVSIY